MVARCKVQGAGKQGVGRLGGRCKQGGRGRAGAVWQSKVQCACTLSPGTRPVRLVMRWM